MGIKKELREFISEVRQFMKVAIVGNKVYEDVIARQAEEIKDLHNKLLARSLPELKTYTQEYENSISQVKLSPLGDYENSGLIADFGDDNE